MESEKPLIDDENHCLEGEEYKKLLFQRVEKAMIEKSITPIFAKNINEVIKIFEMDQIWGRKEIREELSYGDSKAGKTIEVMQLLDVIDSVKGKGKGKYVLKNLLSSEQILSETVFGFFYGNSFIWWTTKNKYDMLLINDKNN